MELLAPDNFRHQIVCLLKRLKACSDIESFGNIVHDLLPFTDGLQQLAAGTAGDVARLLSIVEHGQLTGLFFDTTYVGLQLVLGSKTLYTGGTQILQSLPDLAVEGLVCLCTALAVCCTMQDETAAPCSRIAVKQQICRQITAGTVRY
jgi:hypothetical protein